MTTRAARDPLANHVETGMSEPAKSRPRHVADHGLRPLTLENAAEVERVTRPAPESVSLTHKVDDLMFF